MKVSLKSLVNVASGLILALSGVVIVALPASATTDSTLTLQVAAPSTEVTLPASYASTTYGDGTFVGVSDDAAGYSTNGTTWDAMTMPASEDWQSVTYGDGVFVAVAYDTSVAAYSTNGTTWTEATMPASHNWQTVTYGDGVFVATTANGGDEAAYSTNGETWTETTMPETGDVISITYGDSGFVAQYEPTSSPFTTTNVEYSTNGETWSAEPLPATEQWGPVTYGDGEYVTVSESSNVVAYSTNGTTWTEATLPAAGDSWVSVTYGGGGFVAVAEQGVAAYSTNGETWTQITLPANFMSMSIAYGDGEFYGVGSPEFPSGTAEAVYSTNGTTWNETPLPEASDWHAVTYGDGEFVAFGMEPAVAAVITPIPAEPPVASGNTYEATLDAYDSTVAPAGELTVTDSADGSCTSSVWTADGSDGANGELFTATCEISGPEAVGDSITATYSDSDYGPLTSNTLDVTGAPAITSASITGTAQVGDTLTAGATGVTGSPAPTATYQWYDGSTAIADATSSTYTVQSSDLGYSINVAITETNGVGSPAEATSAGTSDVTPADSAPTITSASITGTPEVGDTLTAVANGVTGNPAPTATYQWYEGSSAITGAASSTYTVQAADVGEPIYVIITETNGVGSPAAAESPSTSGVTEQPAIASATITGNAQVGDTLTAEATGVTGSPTPTATYQWYDGSSAITGATSSTYTVQAADVGEPIYVIITETNGVGSPAALTSRDTADVASRPTPSSITPTPTSPPAPPAPPATPDDTTPAPENLGFSPHAATLESNERTALQVIAKKLTSGSRVTVTGYAKGNAALARRRAEAVAAYLKARAHVTITIVVRTTASNKVTVKTTKK